MWATAALPTLNLAEGALPAPLAYGAQSFDWLLAQINDLIANRQSGVPSWSAMAGAGTVSGSMKLAVGSRRAP
jgi:hypothetical protein